MRLIELDKEKCIKCGLCSKSCVSKIFYQRKPGARVKPVNMRACIDCGHCVAVCPVNAITHNRMEGEFKEIKIREYDEDRIDEFLASKRSVRNFKDESLKKEDIDKILIASCYAPSATNKKARDFIVITDEELLNEIENRIITYFEKLLKLANPIVLNILAFFSKSVKKLARSYIPAMKGMVWSFRNKGESPVFRGGKCVVVIYGPSGNQMSKDDAVACQHYSMLKAHSMGIGSCVIGFADLAQKRFKDLLGLDKKQKIYAVTSFGYPSFNYKKTVPAKPVNVKWMESAEYPEMPEYEEGKDIE